MEAEKPVYGGPTPLAKVVEILLKLKRDVDSLAFLIASKSVLPQLDDDCSSPSI